MPFGAMKTSNPISILTKCELEVAKYIAEGNTTKQTAYILHRSYETVNNHKRNIYEKTGAKSSIDLVWMFIQNFAQAKKWADQNIDLNEIKKSILPAIVLFILTPGIVLGNFDKRYSKHRADGKKSISRTLRLRKDGKA